MILPIQVGECERRSVQWTPPLPNGIGMIQSVQGGASAGAGPNGAAGKWKGGGGTVAELDLGDNRCSPVGKASNVKVGEEQ